VSNIDYSPELSAALDRLVPVDETLRGDWDDVVGRVGVAARRRTKLPRNRHLRLAFVLTAIFFLLAGVATATYFVTRASQPPAAFGALDDNGSLQTVWRCPTSGFGDCGAFVIDAAVARDARHLAFVTDSTNSLSLYQGGLHVIDLTTGADRQLPAARAEPATPAAQFRAWRGHLQAAARLLGCALPRELAWSPDASRLAYVCTAERGGYVLGRTYTIRPDGSGRRLLRTGTASAYWPSWSPDGTRIAFSTRRAPVAHTGRTRDGRPRVWSAIYTVRLDGSHRQLVTPRGAAPDWSPDGETLAYWAPGCGGGNESGRTRLVTPDGRDVTPHSTVSRCGGIGPPNRPIAAWSPDGRRLAVRTWERLYVMDADGSDVIAVPGTDAFGRSRPVWQPPERKGAR
jgi:dipeptidyl aminopeptidase/acylaminoacyl peptidase